jgi:uncharacterized RDD family membrane protein YckC
MARLVLAPARVLGRSPFVAPFVRLGERVATDSADAALERGRRAAVDLASSDSVDRAVARAVENRRLERVVTDAIESRYGHELAERVLASPELERAIERVVASPAVRAGFVKQTSSFGDELRTALRRRARAADERLSRRPGAGYGGVASRGIALALDLTVAFAVALVGVALLGLVSALVGELRPEWLVAALISSGLLLVTGAYFVFFWTVTGQTPAMRLLGLRVGRADGGRVGVARAIVRFVGLLVAIVPFFLGFVPALYDRRRRALPDLLAGTTVVDEERAALPPATIIRSG